MITVKMPRAEWDMVMACLERVHLDRGWIIRSTIEDIANQVNSQEY